MNYEAVVAGLPDAVIATDTSLRVVFWNSAAEAMTGRSTRRAEGRLVKELFAVDSSVARGLVETLATGESRSEGDGTLETRDGRDIPVSIATVPLFARDGTMEG